MKAELSTHATNNSAPDADGRPLVSVIIPTYNRRSQLAVAIDSVLAQSCPDYELIIVDDGSSDDTPALLSSYRGQITVITQENRGVSAARNAGIRRASGKYIAFLDSDDQWLPEKLERQVAFFRSRETAMLCQTEEVWIRNGRRVNPRKRHRKFSGMIFEKTLPLCLVSPSAVMIRKSLFDEVGLFDETLPACEDYDLWLRITWKYPVYLIDTPLVIKTGGHADQLSRMPELDKYRIQALVKILKSGNLSDGQYAAALAILEEKCRIYAGGCARRDRRQEASYFRGLPEALRR